MLDYVEREQIKLISGASAGLFTGYALATDKIDCGDYMYRHINITSKFELFKKVFAKGLISDYWDSLISYDDILSIPLCFPVCYVPLLSTRYYWVNGEYNRIWKRYMQASVNFPFLRPFPSVIDGRFAIDGGTVDNIPLFPLLDGRQNTFAERVQLDLIIVMHFNPRYDYRSYFTTDIPVLDIELSCCNGFIKNHFDYSAAKMNERIDKGYEYGDNICKRLFCGDGSRAYLQSAVDGIFLEEHAERLRHSSLDGLVDKLNIVGRFFRNDARCVKKLF